MKTDHIAKSKGHIAFYHMPYGAGVRELYEYRCDDNSPSAIMSAPVDNVIDVESGYRFGDFESMSDLGRRSRVIEAKKARATFWKGE